jgi:hypothetical protein
MIGWASITATQWTSPHPDSPQGIALLNYLRGAGIPFIAFRSAVPGSATGAHTHWPSLAQALIWVK